MALQVPSPLTPGAGYDFGTGGNLSAIAEQGRQRKKETELERAMSVLSTGQDIDARNPLEKMMGKEQDAMTPERAIGTVQQLAPEVYQGIVEAQANQRKELIAEQQRMEAKLDDFGKDAYPIIEQLEQMPQEERKAFVPAVLEDFKARYPEFAERMNIDLNDDGVLSDDEIKQAKASLARYAPEPDTQVVDGQIVDKTTGTAKPITGYEEPPEKLSVNQQREILEDAAKLPNMEQANLFLKETFPEREIKGFESEDAFKRAKAAMSDTKSGLAISIDKDGEVTISEEGMPGLTASQAGKQVAEYRDQRIATRRLVGLSNEMIESAEERPAELGFTGWVARKGDEAVSVFQNVKSEYGLDTSDVSRSLEDYNFKELAGESAEVKTNALNLALLFATTSGLAKGGRMSDKDVQLALDAIGAGTNSVAQMRSRLRAIQDDAIRGLKITAEETEGLEWIEIPEYQAEIERPKTLVDEKTWDLLTYKEKKEFVSE